MAAPYWIEIVLHTSKLLQLFFSNFPFEFFLANFHDCAH